MTRYILAVTADDFGVQFTNLPGEIVYDAKTLRGPWATMTSSSFERNGLGKLGLGFGQKYRRDHRGELHKIEG
jgi:hypothetical protein